MPGSTSAMRRAGLPVFLIGSPANFADCLIGSPIISHHNTGRDRRVGGGGGLMLDAGEGVLGQLVRRHGRQGAQEVVAALAAVWVSHKHADHLLGLPALLAARPRQAPPLLVIGAPRRAQCAHLTGWGYRDVAWAAPP